MNIQGLYMRFLIQQILVLAPSVIKF